MTYVLFKQAVETVLITEKTLNNIKYSFSGRR